MKIGIVGTGYVGLVAATCLADAGHDLLCVDSNPEKMLQLRSGQVPFFEPDLDELFKKNQARMRFVDEISTIAADCEVIFIAVGTPERPDGSSDMEPTFCALQEICKGVSGPRIVVLKSTVPIGTAARASTYCQENCRHPVEVVSNPEFLRQGAAVKDFLCPSRVVIGCSAESAKRTMIELYRPFVNEEKILTMDNTSAEMVKYAANSFLALKISFINELSLLAGKLGADIDQVRAGFTSDHRINPAFFNPGIGYGGSCFPKDVHALVFAAGQVGLELKLLKAADEVNERQKMILTDRLHKRFSDLRGKKIALWGLAFKPNTDDVRRAPSIQIIEDLVRFGAKISAYDPVAMTNARKTCLGGFRSASSPLDAAQDADAVLIITEWEEFKNVDLRKLKDHMRTPVIFDGRNLFQPQVMADKGFEYYSIGRPTVPLMSTSESKKDNPLTMTAWF